MVQVSLYRIIGIAGKGHVCIVAAVRDNLPNEHLGCGILYLTAVAVIHLWVAKRKDLLNVAPLKIVQFQLPIGGTAGFIGSVGGVILSAQRCGVWFYAV